MQILFNILYILLFIVCLSALIVIHEAGHLIAAKAFKVYCFEYSIGFGPKLFSFKRKGGETQFTLRGIPFGGYVSMYGEGVEVPEGLDIPPERNLENIKKWKKGIILVAGVTMNAVLAIIIFLISNLCFPVTDYYFNPITVSETSKFKDVIKNGSIVELVDKQISGYYVLSTDGLLSYKDDVEKDDVINVAVLLNPAISSQDKLDWSNFLSYVTLNSDDTISESFTANQDIKNISFPLLVKEKAEQEEFEEVLLTLNCLSKIEEEKTTYYFESPGISITTDTYMLGWRAFGKTFEDFGTSSTAIVRAFGSLFVSQEARDSIGGIIAIGFESTNILKNFGFNQFLRVWGLISVNLAIVNLLPFPGLDGWQLLVLIVEGVSRKKIPDKVKNIVSLVGLALLFGLMILLVFKDVFTYII